MMSHNTLLAPGQEKGEKDQTTAATERQESWRMMRREEEEDTPPPPWWGVSGKQMEEITRNTEKKKNCGGVGAEATV